ncbi:unnamed protein product [Rotaria socialis]|uniref:Glutathione S-transferase omega n=2 Tax=Rotaria socialis TaxID=392032 RepID=A0A820RVJ0_9BILA|nr:unnamed protein product [Rotaria socialis]CAF3471293.1 unnamed protein product [Rotaria socialis]CAF3541835.1 unnamed protein product [Rotaria socialis]CAF4322097.1 unnamed protein product [Rotaria socialis]CAF4443834.1 unnamed protein product [Rotaria socialis]
MATNRKHLKSGSTCPPLKENLLRLYNMRFGPFGRRVKLVLTAKNIPYEEILVNLTDIPEWYLKKNPSGEVPILEWIDPTSNLIRSIPESMIICNYIDDFYPEHHAHSADPYVKAKQQILIDHFGNCVPFFHQVFGQKSQESFDKLYEALVVYEEALDSQFFGGSKPGMLDFMIWPWFELLSALLGPDFNLNSTGKLPKLVVWFKNMLANDTVIKTKGSPEILLKYVKTVAEGKPNYDVE